MKSTLGFGPLVFVFVLVVAVSIFFLLRLLLLVLRRWLRSKIGKSVIFKSFRGGIEVQGGSFVLPLRSGLISSVSLAWQSVKMQWPTWKLPFHLEITGLTCEVKQMRIPECVHGRAAGGKWNGRELKVMQILETLLWTGSGKKGHKSSLITSMQDSFSHAVLSFLIRNISCSLQLSTVLYVQEGEPGPYLSGSFQENQQKDAIKVTIRAVRLGQRDPLQKSANASSLLVVSGVDMHLLSCIPSTVQDPPPTEPLQKRAPIRVRGKHSSRQEKARKLRNDPDPPPEVETLEKWSTSSCVLRQWGLEMEVYCLIGGKQASFALFDLADTHTLTK